MGQRCDLRKPAVPRPNLLVRKGFVCCPTCPTLSHGAVPGGLTCGNTHCPTRSVAFAVPRLHASRSQRCDLRVYTHPTGMIMPVPRLSHTWDNAVTSKNTNCPTRSKSGTPCHTSVPRPTASRCVRAYARAYAHAREAATENAEQKTAGTTTPAKHFPTTAPKNGTVMNPDHHPSPTGLSETR
jgi:hypothetical protein